MPVRRVWAVYDGHGSADISSYLHSSVLPALAQRLCTEQEAEQGASAASSGAETAAQAHVRASLRAALGVVTSQLEAVSACGNGTSSQDADCDNLHVASSVPGLAAAAAAAWESGSTAVMAVAAWPLDCPAFLYTASVGNSRALLCWPDIRDAAASSSGRAALPAEPPARRWARRGRPERDDGEAARGTSLAVEWRLLTRDHELSDPEERSRVEAAGGHVEPPSQRGEKDSHTHTPPPA